MQLQAILVMATANFFSLLSDCFVLVCWLIWPSRRSPISSTVAAIALVDALNSAPWIGWTPLSVGRQGMLCQLQAANGVWSWLATILWTLLLLILL